MADKITRANNLLRQAVDLLNPNPNPPNTGVPVGDSRASHDSGEPSSSVRIRKQVPAPAPALAFVLIYSQGRLYS